MRDSVQNVSQHLGFVLCPVHYSGDGVWEETLLPKKSLNCWFKSCSLNTDLEGGDCECLKIFTKLVCMFSPHIRNMLLTYLKNVIVVVKNL